MQRNAIDPGGFETKFQSDPDPWDYETSPFEAHKRRVLLRACGPRRYGRALEIGCAIGVTTRALARIAGRLLAVDPSPTALKEAARRTRDLRNVALRRLELPERIPGSFDLIVVSEVLYYLPELKCRQAVSALRAALAPGGRIVLLHHIRDFDDASQRPWLAQERAAAILLGSMAQAFRHRESRFVAEAFVARRR